MKHHRCSKCGKPGHNRQTCGTVPYGFSPATISQSVKMRTDPHRPEDRIVDVSYPGAYVPPFDAARMFHTRMKQVEAVDGDEFHGLSQEEIETWWLLHGDNNEQVMAEDPAHADSKKVEQQVEIVDNFLAFTATVPPSIRETVEFSRFLMNRPAGLQIVFLKTADCPAQVTDFFVRNGTRNVRAMIAKFPGTSTDTLSVLGKDPDGRVKSFVAQHFRTADTALVALADDEDIRVRENLSTRSRIPDAAAEILGKDIVPRIRRNIAAYKGCPRNVLSNFVKDNDLAVRETVATRNDLTAELVDKLKNDTSTKVRKRIVLNSAVPLDVAESMADDEAKTVRLAVQQRLRVGR